MGHAKCRLIHGIDFFNDRQHVYMDCVVCVTVARSFACAPRWGVALIGFVSTKRSSPHHGNPIFRYWSRADRRHSLEANS